MKDESFGLSRWEEKTAINWAEKAIKKSNSSGRRWKDRQQEIWKKKGKGAQKTRREWVGSHKQKRNEHRGEKTILVVGGRKLRIWLHIPHGTKELVTTSLVNGEKREREKKDGRTGEWEGVRGHGRQGREKEKRRRRMIRRVFFSKILCLDIRLLYKLGFSILCCAGGLIL